MKYYIYTAVVLALIVGTFLPSTVSAQEANPPAYTQFQLTQPLKPYFSGASASTTYTVNNDHIRIDFSVANPTIVGVSGTLAPVTSMNPNVSLGSLVFDYDMTVTSGTCRLGNLSLSGTSTGQTQGGTINQDYITRAVGTYARNTNSALRFHGFSHLVTISRAVGVGITANGVPPCVGFIRLYSITLSSGFCILCYTKPSLPYEQTVVEFPEFSTTTVITENDDLVAFSLTFALFSVLMLIFGFYGTLVYFKKP